MFKNRLEIILISYKTNSVFIDWIQINFFNQNSQKYERSQTVFSSAVVIKSVFLNSSTETENSLFFESSKTTSYSSQQRWNEFSNKNFFYKFIFKKLFAISTFKNSYVNEFKIWASESNAFCVKCEKTDHIFKNCNDIILLTWKQFYLKNIVFENIFQINFCVVDYEIYDENVFLYEKKFSKKSNQYYFESSFSKTETYVFEFVNFVIYEVSSDFLFQNLLIFFKIYLHQSDSFLWMFSMKKSQNQINDFIWNFSLQNQKKKTYWNKKKTDFQFLMNMFNDATKIYDKSVSVRQILKNNKMNMSLLNFMIWFSKTCREMKRLITKMIKKNFFKMTFKISKAISDQNSIFQFEIILFFLNFNIFQFRIMLSSLIQNEFFIFQFNISEQINVLISIHFSP